MCGYFCIGFIDFMLKGKSLFDYRNVFLLWLWKEWQIMTKIFSITQKMKKSYCVIWGKYRNFEKPKIAYLFEKH